MSLLFVLTSFGLGILNASRPLEKRFFSVTCNYSKVHLKEALDRNHAWLLEFDVDRLLIGFFISAGLELKAERYSGWELRHGMHLDLKFRDAADSGWFAFARKVYPDNLLALICRYSSDRWDGSVRLGISDRSGN